MSTRWKKIVLAIVALLVVASLLFLYGKGTGSSGQGSGSGNATVHFGTTTTP